MLNAIDTIVEAIKTHDQILHLGAGKVPSEIIEAAGDNKCITNVDMCYDKNLVDMRLSRHRYIKSDIFDFLNSNPYRYDLIIANRIFEHQFYDSGEIGYLLSCCYSSLETTGRLIIIVPNHALLVKSMLEFGDRPLPHLMARDLLLLNTEFCNTKFDPHGSIWTPIIAHYYIEQEGVWLVDKLQEQIRWEGRDCYMMLELVKK